MKIYIPAHSKKVLQDTTSFSKEKELEKQRTGRVR